MGPAGKQGLRQISLAGGTEEPDSCFQVLPSERMQGEEVESPAKTDWGSKPRDGMLFTSTQRVQNCCFYTDFFFNNNFPQCTLILTDQYHIHVNSTHHLHFTTVWKEWWKRRGIASGIICENISLTGAVGKVTLQESLYLKSV